MGKEYNMLLLLLHRSVGKEKRKMFSYHPLFSSFTPTDCCYTSYSKQQHQQQHLRPSKSSSLYRLATRTIQNSVRLGLVIVSMIIFLSSNKQYCCFVGATTPTVHVECESNLFELAQTIRVIGPTTFPKPTRMYENQYRTNLLSQNKKHSEEQQMNEDETNQHNQQQQQQLIRRMETIHQQEIDNDSDNDSNSTTELDEDRNVVVVVVEPTLRPVYGVHNQQTKDVIFAYAEGYKLQYYMMFLETLQDTGYNGDVVFAIAENAILKPNVLDYLRTYTTTSFTSNNNPNKKLNVILYQIPMLCEPREGGYTVPDGGTRQLVRSGDTDVFQMCQIQNVYSFTKFHINDKMKKRNIQQQQQQYPIVNDIRDGRVVATIRYELYWIWSLQYPNPYTWIMLIDARDSFFQSNPFANLPRRRQVVKETSSKDKMDDDDDDAYDNEDDAVHDSTTNIPGGLLYFFGENINATRIGKSTKNANWILKGYGQSVLNALVDKPTICSGSTMGEKIAMETYLRAMVTEHDENTIKMTGSDQGFHNYLYYSGKLLNNIRTISKIIVWTQGKGIINNLGALRTKPFVEWGIYNTTSHEVYQFDDDNDDNNDNSLTTSSTTTAAQQQQTKKKRILSPVCHQFDRDKALHSYMIGTKHKQYLKQWELIKTTIVR